MKKILTLCFALLMLFAGAAKAGDTLASGSYTMNLGNGPVEFIACAAMWPFPASVMVGDISYTLEEDGKYHNGPVSFEFTSPGLVEKVRNVPPPMSGPPVITDGSYGSN